MTMCDSEKYESGLEKAERPFTPEKLIGVGLVGSIASLVLYYLYHQLNSETRRTIKDNLMAVAKAQLKKIGES